MTNENASKIAEQWARVKEVEADLRAKRQVVRSAIEYAWERQAAFEAASAVLNYEARKLEKLLDEAQP